MHLALKRQKCSMKNCQTATTKCLCPVCGHCLCRGNEIHQNELFQQDERKKNNNQNKTSDDNLCVQLIFTTNECHSFSDAVREWARERDTQPLHLTKFYLIWFHYSLNSRLLLSLTKCTHTAHIRRWNCAGSISNHIHIVWKKI